jgi:hypothetical protein
MIASDVTDVTIEQMRSARKRSTIFHMVYSPNAALLNV